MYTLSQREIVIKRIMELQRELWISLYWDPIEYFEAMDYEELEMCLEAEEYAKMNRV